MSIGADATHKLVLGDLKFDSVRNELHDVEGQRVHLRAQTVKVLSLLAQNAGDLVDRDTLINHVWGDIAVTEDSLTQCISEIRKAIGDRRRTILRTISKSGFILDGRVDLPAQIFKAVPHPFLLAAAGVDLEQIENQLGRYEASENPAKSLERCENVIIVKDSDPATLIRAALELTMLQSVRVGLATAMEGEQVAKDLAQIAASGQILATADMWDAKKETIEFDFKDLGLLKTTSSGGAVRVVEILKTPLHAMHLGRARNSDPRPTITVIPPHAQLANTHQDVLGAVIADDITAALTTSPELNVTSRFSTEMLRREQSDLTDLSKQFGADFVVSGHYRQIGEKLHIGIEFADTRSNNILWFERIKTSVDDILEGGSTLEDVTAKIKQSIILNEVKKLENQPLSTLEDFTLLFGAIGLMHRLSQADFHKSRIYLDELAARAPNQPVVLAWLSRWFILLVHQGWSTDPQRDAKLSLDCTKRALDIEPNNTLALAGEGHVLTNLYQRFDLAEDRFHQALTINPNDATSHLLRGTFHAFQGKGEQAEQDAARALQLSPFDPHRFYFLAHAAGASLANHQNERALQLANNSLNCNRFHASTLRIKTVAHVRLNEMDRATETVAKLMEVQPKLRVKDWLATSPSRNFETGKSFAADMKRAGVPN